MNKIASSNQAFLDQYGPVMSCDELGSALIRAVDYRLADQAAAGSPVNCLVGFQWDLNYTINLPCHTQDYQLTTGYVGRIWIRFERDYVGNPARLFQDTGFVLGQGGYSTWQGPWNQTGLEFNRWETGVPYNLRTRPLAAFAFTCQFYVQDFPGIDQSYLMAKLSDQPISTDSRFSWEDPDLRAADHDYINYLRSL